MGTRLSDELDRLVAMRQQSIDYGFTFAKHFFHGEMVALLSGKVSPELLKEVEDVFK